MTIADTAVVAQLSNVQVVALTLYGEARGSTKALRLAIAATMHNRVQAKRAVWGLDARAVCLKRAQFSCWLPSGGAVNYAEVMRVARGLLAGDPPAAFPRLTECLSIAAVVVAGTLTDTLRGATHYYSPNAMVPRNRVPTWAIGLTPVAVIGGTRFFAGVR